jgi:WD40 repeat protein
VPGVIAVERGRPLRRASCARTSEVALEDFARALAWSPCGRSLLAVTLAGTAHLRDPSGAWLGVPGLHNGGAYSCAWSPDGARFVTGGGDGRLFLHDRRSLSLIAEAHVDEAWAEQVAWSPDGASFVAVAGRSARFFTRDGERVGQLARLEGSVAAARWLESLGAVLVASHGGAQLVSPKGISKRWPSKGATFAARVSRDERWLALGKHDGSVDVHDLATGREAMIAGHRRKVAAVAWSDGAPLLASTGGNELVVWPFDAEGPCDDEPAVIAPHRGVVTACEFSARGERLLSVGEDGLFHVARTRTWGCEFLDTTNVPLSSIALSDDGRNVAAAGRRGRVFTWRLGA